MKNLLKKLGLVGALALPLVSKAVIIPDKPDGLPDAYGAGQLDEFILGIINDYLLPLAGLIAVVFIIIGGYQYIFSGANEDLAEKGKKTLTNAIIGLVIVILSYVIVRVIATTLDAS